MNVVVQCITNGNTELAFHRATPERLLQAARECRAREIRRVHIKRLTQARQHCAPHLLQRELSRVFGASGHDDHVLKPSAAVLVELAYRVDGEDAFAVTSAYQRIVYVEARCGP